jgi:thiol-disulfide isomerase/thioredoxin
MFDMFKFQQTPSPSPPRQPDEPRTPETLPPTFYNSSERVKHILNTSRQIIEAEKNEESLKRNEEPENMNDYYETNSLTPSDFSGTKDPSDLINSNKNGRQGSLVVFRASWCGHCVRFGKDYNELVRRARSMYKDVNVWNIDCGKYQSFSAQCNKNVKSFPTIIMYDAQGRRIEKAYDGERSVENLLKFIGENR